MSEPKLLTAEEKAAIRKRCDAGNLHEALNDLRRALDDIEARERECERLTVEVEKATQGRNESAAHAMSLVQRANQHWLESPAFDTFVRLKHGPIGIVLTLLQEGQISRGKCAEVLAELAHGVAPEDVRLPAFKESPFIDDQTPTELCAAKDAEIARLREALAEARKICAEIVQGKKVVGVSARIKLAMDAVLLIDRALTPPPERTPEQAE